METRKIQLAGGSTYTVSLPKEWASEHGLEAGARVRVYPHADGSLVVRTNGHAADGPDALTIAADDRAPAALRRAVRAGYRTGRDAVVVTGDPLAADQRRAVREAADGLLGVDVVEETDSRVVCKSLLDPADVSVEQSLHQLQYVACAAHRDAVAALLADRDPRGVADREAEAARFAALVARQFERALVDPGALDDLAVSRSTLFDYDAAARHLERVVAHAASVAAAAGDGDAPVPADAADALERTAADARDLVERATGALLDGPDADAACEVLAAHDRFRGDARDAAAVADAPGRVGLAYHSLVASGDCAGAVAEVALRAATRDAA